MTTQLLPMSEHSFAGFFELAVSNYAHDNVAAGRWPAADGLALARSESERLLPAGLATPDHHFFDIVEVESGRVAGHLWMAAMARGSSRIAYVYQVMVKPAFQRRGHARAALLAAEQQARALGLSGMALHVFGFNAGAQALYASLGYQVSSLNLAKQLA